MKHPTVMNEKDVIDFGLELNRFLAERFGIARDLQNHAATSGVTRLILKLPNTELWSHGKIMKIQFPALLSRSLKHMQGTAQQY